MPREQPSTPIDPCIFKKVNGMDWHRPGVVQASYDDDVRV
jgi:hypothetical protein